MAESTKTKHNRAEKKNKKQQIKESEMKNVNDDDNDNVFQDSQQQQVYLLLYYVYRLIFRMCAAFNLFTYLLILFHLLGINKIFIIISEIT